MVERLRELAIQTARHEAEAAGILLGLGIDAEMIGWDDGDHPALLLKENPMSDETTEEAPAEEPEEEEDEAAEEAS